MPHLHATWLKKKSTIGMLNQRRNTGSGLTPNLRGLCRNTNSNPIRSSKALLGLRIRVQCSDQATTAGMDHVRSMQFIMNFAGCSEGLVE